jgi:hypothetical protein
MARIRLTRNQSNPEVLAYTAVIATEALAPSAIFPYCDSVDIFFHGRGQREANQALYAAIRRWGRVDSAHDRNKQWRGYRLSLQLPNRNELGELDRLIEQWEGVISRVDIALDMPAADGGELREWLESHLILRWGRRCVMKEVDGTRYWIRWEVGRRRPNRNLVLYDDCHNKITGEVPCVHLELRLLNAKTVRKEGIVSLTKLLTLNPRELFNKHLKWNDAGELYLRKRVRAEVTKMRKTYGGREITPGLDRYCANHHRRVERLLRNNGQHLSQVLKNEKRWMRKRLKEPMPLPLNIPTRLCWPGGAAERVRLAA